MSKAKAQLTIRLPEEEKQRIKMAMEAFDCKSQNEFVVEAVKFYTAYLLSGGGVKALFPELMKAWEADMNKVENRMGSLLYKTALELNMLSNIMAAFCNVSDETLSKLRARCVREVKQSRGKISLRDAMEYQR